MSIFSRLRRLPISHFLNANFEPWSFAAAGLGSFAGRVRKAKQNGPKRVGDRSLARYGRRNAYFHGRAEPAAAHSRAVDFNAECQVSDADISRFCSDLDAMLASLSDCGRASSQDHVSSQFSKQEIFSTDTFGPPNEPSPLEADVADAVRRLFERV